jgi:hypothetical protein
MKFSVRRVFFTLIMSLLLAGGVLGLPHVAHAAPNATYIYQPGHPMYFGGPASSPWVTNECTGGYVIRGTSGTFLLGAGHCDPNLPAGGSTVYGTDSSFGVDQYNHFIQASDTMLVQEFSYYSAYQTVVDPTTGRTPGGNGKVVGFLSDSQLGSGLLVGKMGVSTGWTEGTIVDWTYWQDDVALCTTYTSAPGDSGGPVWRTAPGGGVYAVGIHVGQATLTINGAKRWYSCFLPIQDLLNHWGASLPVWSSANTVSMVKAPAAESLPVGLPELFPTSLIPD